VPYKPAKPCAVTGCPELVTERYCDAHRKDEYKRYNKYDRDPGTNARYSGAWKQIRALYLSNNPLCELCQREGKLTAATLVHHKIKVTDGGSNHHWNLQALCLPCHSRLHCQQGDYF